MTDIDLTPMNEATARALFAEQYAARVLDQIDPPTPEAAAELRINVRNTAKQAWDDGNVDDDTVLEYRELALAATLTNWRNVARQAWQQGHDTPRDYVIDQTLDGQDPQVIIGPSEPNPYEEATA